MREVSRHNGVRVFESHQNDKIPPLHFLAELENSGRNDTLAKINLPIAIALLRYRSNAKKLLAANEACHFERNAARHERNGVEKSLCVKFHDITACGFW